jgi:hypothetical protein
MTALAADFIFVSRREFFKTRSLIPKEEPGVATMAAFHIR